MRRSRQSEQPLLRGTPTIAEVQNDVTRQLCTLVYLACPESFRLGVIIDVQLTPNPAGTPEQTKCHPSHRPLVVSSRASYSITSSHPWPVTQTSSHVIKDALIDNGANTSIDVAGTTVKSGLWQQKAKKSKARLIVCRFYSYDHNFQYGTSNL